MTDALVGSVLGACLGTLIVAVMRAVIGRRVRHEIAVAKDPDRWMAELDERVRSRLKR